MHTIYIVVHVAFANIFLLNYLIAILSTVYEDMMEMGDFAYKCNKYKYIERYMIAFKDEWGYTELIVHAPPLNIPLVFLVPCVFKQDMMLRISSAYSLVNFWFENLVFMVSQLIHELILVPWIYIRVFYNVIKLAGLGGMHLLLGWSVGGLFYLLYGVGLDMYYYVKIMCDYKMDDDKQVKMEEEDMKQDKIVIFNEIISVLKSILFLFQQKQNQKLKRTGCMIEGLTGKMSLEDAL